MRKANRAGRCRVYSGLRVLSYHAASWTCIDFPADWVGVALEFASCTNIVKEFVIRALWFSGLGRS